MFFQEYFRMFIMHCTVVISITLYFLLRVFIIYLFIRIVMWHQTHDYTWSENRAVVIFASKVVKLLKNMWKRRYAKKMFTTQWKMYDSCCFLMKKFKYLNYNIDEEIIGKSSLVMKELQNYWQLWQFCCISKPAPYCILIYFDIKAF